MLNVTNANIMNKTEQKKHKLVDIKKTHTHTIRSLEKKKERKPKKRIKKYKFDGQMQTGGGNILTLNILPHITDIIIGRDTQK